MRTPEKNSRTEGEYPRKVQLRQVMKSPQVRNSDLIGESMVQLTR